MVASTKLTWVAGSIVAGLLILVAAWFWLISPTMSDTASIHDQTTQSDAHNDALQAQLVTLKAQFAKLPELKTELASAQTQIPATTDLPGFLRQLQSLAQTDGVTVTSVTPSAPIAFGSTAGATTTTPTSGLLAVPVSIAVQGSWEGTVAFLTDLQKTGPRLIAVQAVSGNVSEGTAGQSLTVTGQILELAGTAGTTSSGATATATAAPTLPAPAAGKNPLSTSAN